MLSAALYVSIDSLLKVAGVRRADDGTPITDATIAFVVKDSVNNPVAGASGSLAYVAARESYEGTLESTVVLTVGATYYVELTIASGGLNDFRRIESVAQYRGVS